MMEEDSDPASNPSHIMDAANRTLHDPKDYDQYIPCGYYAFTEPEVQVSQFIRMYIFPIILFMGLVGNPLTACALYLIGIRKCSTVFYLSLLAGVDLLILLIRCGDSWYAQIVKRSLSHQIMNASDALCKTYNFVFMFIKHMSPWLVVAVSVELMITTKWPRRTYVVCTMERARNVVMLLIILIFCLDINHFWTWGVPQRDVGCRYTEEFSNEFRDMIWPAMTNTVELLLPLIFVSVCFFITAATMISRKSRDEKSIEEELKKYFMEMQTIKDFKVICLLICLVFMCLTLFKIILNIVDFMFVKGHWVLDCEGKSKFMLIMQLMKTLDMVFTFLFYTLKFVLYLVCSQTFKKILINGALWWKRQFINLFRKIPFPGHKESKRIWTAKTRSGMAPYQMRPLVDDSQSSPETIEEDMTDKNHVDNEYVDGMTVAAVENHSWNDPRSSFVGRDTHV